jgi:hypothetical protein
MESINATIGSSLPAGAGRQFIWRHGRERGTAIGPRGASCLERFDAGISTEFGRNTLEVA